MDLEIEFGPERGVIATVEKNDMALWDLAKGEKRHTLKNHEDGVDVVTFSADGVNLASADGAGTIRIWKSDGELQQTIKVAGADITALATAH